MRMFKGANLARTRSLASFCLLACMRSPGALSREGTAQHTGIAGRKMRPVFKRFFITPVTNQWLRNWLRVRVNVSRKRKPEAYSRCSTFYFIEAKGQFSFRLSLKRTHSVIITTSPHKFPSEITWSVVTGK